MYCLLCSKCGTLVTTVWWKSFPSWSESDKRAHRQHIETKWSSEKYAYMEYQSHERDGEEQIASNVDDNDSDSTPWSGMSTSTFSLMNIYCRLKCAPGLFTNTYLIYVDLRCRRLTFVGCGNMLTHMNCGLSLTKCCRCMYVFCRHAIRPGAAACLNDVYLI